MNLIFAGKIYKMKKNALWLLTCVLSNLLLAQSHELVYWGGSNTSTTFYPQSGEGLAPEVSSAEQNYNGLSTHDDFRTAWFNPNNSPTVDPSTTPYLSYSLNLSKPTDFDRFVMHGAGPFPSAVKMQLRWSEDNYASSLGEFTPGSSSYNLTSVDISDLAPVFDGHVEFRIYFYDQNSYVYNSHTGPYPSLDGTPSSYTSSGRIFSIWGDEFSTEELVYWRSFNTLTTPYPLEGNVNSLRVSTANLQVSGLTFNDDSRTVFNVSNPDATVDPLTAPYLSFTVNLNEELELDRFVAGGLAPLPATINMQLRWSHDNFATSLGEFTPGTSSYNLSSVDLRNLPVITDENIEFRIYYYGGTSMVFHVNARSNYLPLDGTPALYNTSGGNFGIWGTPSCTSVSDIEVSSCGSYESPSGNYIWNTDGEYMDTIPNAAGCDSIITIDLTILNPSNGTDVVSAVDSYTWIDGITYTESNNTAQHTLVGGNAEGCDSVVSLDLTIVEYCASRSTRRTFEWIKEVDLGTTIENVSGTDAGGYGDYTDQILIVDTGDVVTVELTPGYRRRAYKEGWRIWADWNFDGDFDDAGEKVFEQMGKNVRTGSFVVPVNVSPNDVRLRVTMSWKRYVSACGSFRLGEVEDYTIRVNGAQGYIVPLAPKLSNEAEIASIDERFEFIDIYPSPVTQGEFIEGYLRVEKQGEKHIQIVNTLGQVVKNMTINCTAEENRFEISSEGLSKGIYFIRMNSSTETLKVIVK